MYSILYAYENENENKNESLNFAKRMIWMACPPYL